MTAPQFVASESFLIGLPYHDAPQLIDGLISKTIKIRSPYKEDFCPVVILPDLTNSVDPDAMIVAVPGEVFMDGKTRKLGYLQQPYASLWKSILTISGKRPADTDFTAYVRLTRHRDETEKGALWKILNISNDPRATNDLAYTGKKVKHHFYLQKSHLQKIYQAAKPKRREKNIEVWL